MTGCGNGPRLTSQSSPVKPTSCVRHLGSPATVPVTSAPPSGESSMPSMTPKARDSLSEKTCRSRTPAALRSRTKRRAKLKHRRSPPTFVRGPNNLTARRLRWRVNSPLPPELSGKLASLDRRTTAEGSSRGRTATARTDAVPGPLPMASAVGFTLWTSRRTVAPNRCRNRRHRKDSRRSGHSRCRHKWPLPRRRHHRPPLHPCAHPRLVWRGQASANA